MSIIGIDIGSAGCVITTIEKGSLKLVRNDVSEVITPTLVGYLEEERLIGGSAEIKSNAKNTCRGMKNLVGRTLDDPVAQLEKDFVLGRLDTAEDGSVGYVVNYRGEERVISASAVMGTLLGGLKRLAEKSIDSSVRDVVIAVPGTYGDAQRRALIQSAKVAGLNCLRVMSEHTAVALDYGIYRRAGFDEKEPTHVAFVCGGQSSCIVAVVAFTAQGLKVLSEEVDLEATGRNFDLAIIRKFSEPFDAKHGTNLLRNGKARLKLEDAASKAKKVLSANNEAPFNVECVFEELDISGSVTRDEFTAACAPFCDRITALVSRAVEKAGLTASQLHSVELVGGCTRIPFVQNAVKAAVGDGVELARTLHMDECVSRGCALQAAMLSPAYRVKEFAVVDRLTQKEVLIRWSKEDGTPKEAPLFPQGAPLNSSKVVTFDRVSPIDLEVVLRKPEDASEESLGVYRVEVPAGHSTPLKVKVGIDLDIHGRVEVLSATSTEEKTVTEMQKVRKPKEEKAEGAEKTEEGEKVEEDEWIEKEVTKTVSERKTLKITPPVRVAIMTETQLSAAVATEQRFFEEDLAHVRVQEALNELEALCYAGRDLVSEYAAEDEKAALSKLVEETESWVYDYGFELNKVEIESRLGALKTATAKVTLRKQEEARRADELPRLRATLEEAQRLIDDASEAFAHIEAKSREPLQTLLSDVNSWFADVTAKQNFAAPTSDPIFLVADADKKISQAAAAVNKLMATPKPKPAKEAPAQQPAAEETPKEGDVDMEEPEKTAEPDMDLD